MKPNMILRIAAVAAALALASCYTMKGVGEDVGAVGSGISKGADKVQRKMTR